jgi:hypothetical protein
MSEPATPPPSSGNKTWLFVGLGAFGCLAVVVVLLLAGGYYWWTHREPTVERIYQAKEQPTPQPAATPPAGPDLSSPQATAKALQQAWNAADYDAFLRLTTGKLHDKILHTRDDAPRQFSRMKVVAIGEVSPIAKDAEGHDTCTVKVTTESEGKQTPDKITLVKVGPDWLLTDL